MIHAESQKPENWQMLHNALRDDLQTEIHLTRELLANMHQEEVSLMLHDTGSLNLVLQQRSSMLDKLSSLRLRRQDTLEKIEKIAPCKNKHPSQDELLPPNDDTSTEILSLSDQLMALTQKLNRQHTYNQHLTEHGDFSRQPQLQPSAQPRPKRKASVATLQIKK